MPPTSEPVITVSPVILYVLLGLSGLGGVSGIGSLAASSLSDGGDDNAERLLAMETRMMAHEQADATTRARIDVLERDAASTASALDRVARRLDALHVNQLVMCRAIKADCERGTGP